MQQVQPSGLLKLSHQRHTCQPSRPLKVVVPSIPASKKVCIILYFTTSFNSFKRATQDSEAGHARYGYRWGAPSLACNLIYIYTSYSAPNGERKKGTEISVSKKECISKEPTKKKNRYQLGNAFPRRTQRLKKTRKFKDKLLPNNDFREPLRVLYSRTSEAWVDLERNLVADYMATRPPSEVPDYIGLHSSPPVYPLLNCSIHDFRPKLQTRELLLQCNCIERSEYCCNMEKRRQAQRCSCSTPFHFI